MSSSSTHTGANGDYSGRFTNVTAPHSEPVWRSNMMSTADQGAESLAGIESTAPSGTTARVGGYSWLTSDNKGSAGEFDDWNPRAEVTAGSAAINTPTLGDRVVGAVEEISGRLTNDADRVDEGERRQIGARK